MSIKLKKSVFWILFLSLTQVMFCYADKSSLTNTLSQRFDADNKAFLDISGDGLYLIPNNLLDKTSLLSKAYSFPTSYDVGYQIKVTYKTQSGRFIFLRWQHFNNEGDNLTKPVDDIDNEGPTNISYSYRSGFEMLSLEGGTTLYFKSKIALSFHGGLTYADMKLDNDYNYITNTSLSTLSHQVGYHYIGGGGAIGIDLLYAVTNHIDAYVNSDFKLISRGGSLITGVNEVDRKVAPVVRTAIDYKTSLTGVLTGVDLAIGATYHRGHFAIHTGWMATLFDEASLQWSGAVLGLKYFA